jgi:D-amino peptidase
MKIYISADIEGITGIAHWDEANADKADYAEFRERMTADVVAACEGAVAAGATEILVKDAHATGRNVYADRLPRKAHLVRGWSGHPLAMVQELEDSFTALALVGYHSPAASGGNPLAHTMSSSKVSRMCVNGEPAAEFHLFAFAAAEMGVPTAFVSGDRALCAEVLSRNASITTVTSMHGVGDSTIGRHPDVVREEIRSGMKQALRGNVSACALSLPDRFTLEIEYHEHPAAYHASHYPGASLADDRTVRVEAERFFDVLRAVSFLV